MAKHKYTSHTEPVSTQKSLLYILVGKQLPDQNALQKINGEVVAYNGKNTDELIEKADSGKYTHICFADASNASLLPLSHQGFMQQRHIKPDTVYCADAHHSADGKKGPKINLWNRFVYGVQKLLTPLKIGHTESGIFYCDAATAGKILQEKTIINSQMANDFAYRLKLHGYHIGYFGYNPSKDAAPKPSLLKIIGSAISNRFYWFFKQPVSALYAKKTGSLSHGNNPVYRLLFGVAFVIALIAMPVLSFDYTITWDEHEDVGYFNEVYSYFKTFGEDKRCLDVDGTMDHSESGVNKNLIPHLVNYGPFVNLLCAFVNDTISPFGLYETRHLIIALFAVWGFLFTGLLGRRLGSWRTALIAFLLIWLTPTIFGHSMNNQKDIPFLAFYISAVYYIVRFIDEAPDFRFKTLFMLAFTMGITMSIRVGGLLVFAYLGLFAALHFIYRVIRKEQKFDFAGIKAYAVPVLVVFFFAYLIGIMFWPAAIQDPVNHPLNALKNFEKFSLVHIYEIFEGKRYYMKDFPWYYIPKSMLITIPLFVLAGFALSLLASPMLIRKYDWKKLGILLFVCVFPVVYVIYKKSAVYSSWRHLLFAYPAIVVLAAAGWEWLLDIMKFKWLKLGVVVVLLALVGRTSYWMIKNHPYQYVYYNEIVGGVNGAYGFYETDYWCQSPRTAIEWLLDNEKDITNHRTTVISNNESHSMSYYAQKQTDSIDIAWARDHEWNKNRWEYAIWTTRTLSHTQMTNGYFPPKGTIHVIKVDDVPLAAIVKRTNYDLAIAEELMKQSLFDSAAGHCKSYIAYDPLEEEAHRQYGLNMLQAQKPQEAIPAFYKSIELCPENYYSWNYLGFVYRNLNKFDSSFYCYNKSIEFKDNMSSAYDGRGDLYFSKGDFRSAKADYEQAINFGGANPYTMYKMGEANFNLNDYNEALKYFGGAIQYNPNLGEAHLRIGMILEKQGNSAAAQQYYQKARELGVRF